MAKTYRALIQSRYRARRRSSELLVTFAAKPEDLERFFAIHRIDCPPDPTAEDFSDCLSALLKKSVTR